MIIKDYTIPFNSYHTILWNKGRPKIKICFQLEPEFPKNKKQPIRTKIIFLFNSKCTETLYVKAIIDYLLQKFDFFM